MLDQLTAELVKVRASGAGTSQAAEARDSIEKAFSHWIRGAPKEKWSFLYDTNGIRYGIQTTNHSECFNMVMRSCRAFPLVGIVEFIMYGCMKYFRERYTAASINISNPQIQLSGRGIRRDKVVQESLITVDGKAFCSCMKPKFCLLYTSDAADD